MSIQNVQTRYHLHASNLQSIRSSFPQLRAKPRLERKCRSACNAPEHLLHYNQVLLSEFCICEALACPSLYHIKSSWDFCESLGNGDEKEALEDLLEGT